MPNRSKCDDAPAPTCRLEVKLTKRRNIEQFLNPNLPTRSGGKIRAAYPT
jgi:hypothetical protein